MEKYYTKQTDFYKRNTPHELAEKFGSPLYVYSEDILRERCREMKNLLSYENFKVNYSTKANSNRELLKIIRSEGLNADAMSPGEIHVLLEAGFKPEEIFYIGNNVSEDEMKYAIDHDILISVDSISQLKQFGRLSPGGEIAVRFNPGVGAGHHEKVVTAGSKTKFGVDTTYISEVKNILKEYNLKLAGINQHIGSLFMDGRVYVEAVRSVLSIAEQFENLDFVDLGGGFGVPYHKQEGQQRLELNQLGSELSNLLEDWSGKYGRKVQIKIEPGRYIVAECGVLLGTVYSVKQNYGTAYAGTDIGFNVLARPVMYDSHHDIEVYKKSSLHTEDHRLIKVNIVGNICESGDIIAKEREIPEVEEGDILGIMDSGAYGYSMSSNYNNRLRPAEVLIREDGSTVLIRRRDTIEDLMRNY